MRADFDFVEDQLPPGLSIIEASAGTGKTYAISHLVPRLLLEGTASCLGEILLVTFTNDAARELSERVRQVLQKLDSAPAPDELLKAPGIHRLREKFDSPAHTEILRKALRDIDMLAVSTIHSFCQRTLQSEGTLCGLPTIPELVPDATEFIEPELYDFWKSSIATDHALAAIATARGWCIDQDQRFVMHALSLEDPECDPPARDFEAALKELKDSPARFDNAACDQLQALLQSVEGWNNAAQDAQYRAETIGRLRASQSLTDPGFLNAVMAIAGVEKWIKANSKAGKALKAQAADLQALGHANAVIRLLDGLAWHWQNHCAAKIRLTAENALRANRQITYDGLIGALRDALRSENGPALAARLRARYKVALIDESQDTDARQFEIFKNIFLGLPREAAAASQRLVLIGDPKQAIYGFRGADVNTYLEAKALAAGRLFALNKTFRSCAPLVEAVNTFFAPSGSLLKTGLEFLPATSGLEHDMDLHLDGTACGSRVEVWLASEAHKETYSRNPDRLASIAGSVASEIVRILSARNAALVTTLPGGAETERRKVSPGDFAVLVSAGFEAEAVAAALHARQVPAIVAKGNDIMQSEEAAELLIVMRAIHEPRRAGLRFAALTTRLLGCDDAELRAIRGDAVEDDRCLQTFQRWQQVQEQKGIAPALALLDSEKKVSQRLAAAALGERRVTNFRQLTDLLQAAAMELGPKPEHLLRWFRQEIANADARSGNDERQQQLESDADAVQIVTMHAAKGLEYNLVFCPFLWSSRAIEGLQKISLSGRRPRLVDVDRAVDPAVLPLLERNAIEDRLRLAYVAMTRAKVRLWLHAGEAAGKAPASALDWILRGDAAMDFEAWGRIAGPEGRGTRHAAALAAMAQACDRIQVVPPPEPTAALWQAPSAQAAGAIAALAAPAVPAAWSVTSFTSLTREKHARGGADTPAPAAAPDLPEPGTPPNAFLSAPGGALMGQAIHDWIECWDFGEPDPAALKTHLRKYDLASETGESPLHESIAAMLGELRGSILPGLGCSVAEACPLIEGSEWHFHLPIARTLSPQLLAQTFARHGDETARRYAALLGNLSGTDLAGFLQGFLDRLAFQGQTWGVIDWKTNKLGATLADYGPDSLLESAMQNHHLLQACLYLVALRRYLGPDTPIAGAWLIYVRAVRAGTIEGVLHIQPPRELLDALDALFLTPAPLLSCAK